MKNMGKGCIYGLLGIGLIIVLLRVLLGDMFGLMFLVVIMVFLSIIGMFANAAQETIKAGKWLGISAILGNVFNNKINADAKVKSGNKYYKKNSKTNNHLVDSAINFVSPEVDKEEIIANESDNDFEEFQEYLKWKKSKESKITIDDIE